MRINRRFRSLTIALTCAALIAAPFHSAVGCTRILWNDNKLAVVVGRTMDWPESTEPVITVFPRGMQRDGGRFGPAVVVTENPARWTSRYGSIVTTIYGVGTADGFNEKGLGAHMLFLTATDFGPRDPGKRGIQAGLWAQYLLDNAATVAEALELMKQIQPVLVTYRGHNSTVHLAIEDATGDSAIIEYLGGQPLVHHGRQFTVMTNDPPFDQQLANLARFDFKDATRNTPLPGNVNPLDRFVRSAFFLNKLPEPKSQREAVAGILAIARNASVPFGAPNYAPGTVYNTEYRTAMDLTSRRYFFELTTAPNVIWMDLSRFNLVAGAPVMTLGPDNIDLSGNVTGKFQKAKKAPF
ncbi:MAG TPA: linear amide C-N hydrolase [Burkholderiaceae bacterium]|nr:linear amide C-N hydrolase [Burkholderiaceae bacterium]